MTNPIYPLEPARLGRYFFGLAVLASGLMQLVNAEFVRLTPPLPAWIPSPSFWARAIGAVLVALGAAIVLGFMTRPAALIVAALLLLSFLFQRVPELLAQPMAGTTWTSTCKVLALTGGAVLIAASATSERRPHLGWVVKLLPLAPVLLGVLLLVCGSQHFMHAAFVDNRMPAGMPLEPRFWTYLTGLVLIAAGICLMIPRTMRLAAISSGAMILLWIILLHIPRSIETKTAFEVAGIFEALAISGVAFLVAAEPVRSRRESIDTVPA
ncbi:MAG: DoxX family membrane protein [Opitutaceae bacterium]